MFTSPPYWVGKDYETQKSELDIDQFITACCKAWTDVVGVDHGRIVIDTGTAAIHRIEKKRKVEVLFLADKWANSLRQQGWIVRHIRIWAKGGDLPGVISPETDVVDQHWEHLLVFERQSHEYVLTFWSPAGRQRGQQKIGTAWAQQGIWSDIQGERSADGLHNAAFPLELPRRHILLYTTEGDLVLEPFCGSGTSLIACEQLGRQCRAVELAPKYVSATLERWAQMTGRQPVLVEDGSTDAVDA